jgi:NitT/TauT family transport system substrate-binding protein
MRRILGLLVTAVLVVAAGCGSSGDDSGEASGGSQQVKVGVIPIVDVAPSTWASRRASSPTATSS